MPDSHAEIKDNLWEFVPYFLVVPRDGTQVTRLGGKCFCMMSQLLSHKHSFLCSASTGTDSLDSAQLLPHPTVSKTKEKLWSLLARDRVGIGLP